MLVRAAVFHKRPDFRGRWQPPHRVQRGPTQERRIVRCRRRLQVQPLQLLQHAVIDEILPGRARVHRRWNHIGERRRDASDHHLRRIPRRDRAFAAADHGYLPVPIDRRHRFIRRGEFGPTGHIAVPAVTEPCRHPQTEMLANTHGPLPRCHRERRQPHVVRTRPRSPLCDPARQRLVILRARLQALAALVSDHRGRLRQQQAQAGIRNLHPPSLRLPRDRQVIRLRIVPEQRQPEPTLPRHRPVAAASVAVRLRKDRHDVIPERHGNVHQRCTKPGRCGQPATNQRRNPTPYTHPEEAPHANSSLMGSVPRSVSGNGRPPGPGRCEA